MKNLFFIFLVLLLTACQTAQVRSVNNNSNSKSVVEPNIDINEFLKKQILLTNKAKFKDNRSLEGASGFLIKYNDTVYAVTAKHLLGEAGGISPEISPSELSKNFISWEMSPRVVKDEKEIVKLNLNGINYPSSFHDILILNATVKSDLIKILIPTFEMPTKDETLYIIGCPYSETNCRQNSYKIKFKEFDSNESLLLAEIETKVNLSGFSGAPVINNQGNIVGVLIGGDKNLVAATHIKEIQKIIK